MTDVVLSACGARTARRITKPALMPVLAAQRPPRGAGAAIGLAGSWAGDVALLAEGDRPFRAGLGAFLLAHLGYATAFARGGRPRAAHLVPAAVFTATSAVVFGRLAGPLGRPVRAYAVAIGAMGAAATTVRGPGARRIAAGAALFITSDALLGLGRFGVIGRRPELTDAAVMTTYALAQWLIHDGLSARN
ncbi:lysoplasmalogenase [Saccharopolyspora sp. CA-218241]|uniref:lysoplasmalogenase n=1 Tax=Saccharopolyspora sp. CA-218241 TaxID=3240027 RepID=UPI003D952A08